jgi:hypothetical protein
MLLNQLITPVGCGGAASRLLGSWEHDAPLVLIVNQLTIQVSEPQFTQQGSTREAWCSGVPQPHVGRTMLGQRGSWVVIGSLLQLN